MTADPGSRSITEIRRAAATPVHTVLTQPPHEGLPSHSARAASVGGDFF
jgi:hypothetical protein